MGFIAYFAKKSTLFSFESLTNCAAEKVPINHFTHRVSRKKDHKVLISSRIIANSWEGLLSLCSSFSNFELKEKMEEEKDKDCGGRNGI